MASINNRTGQRLNERRDSGQLETEFEANVVRQAKDLALSGGKSAFSPAMCWGLFRAAM
jgi:hypothetical protein